MVMVTVGIHVFEALWDGNGIDNYKMLNKIIAIDRRRCFNVENNNTSTINRCSLGLFFTFGGNIYIFRPYGFQKICY